LDLNFDESKNTDATNQRKIWMKNPFLSNDFGTLINPGVFLATFDQSTHVEVVKKSDQLKNVFL
jgi:hypothetical protein